jgi:hypothetical protein
LDQVQVRKLSPTDPLAYDTTSGLPSFGTRNGGTEGIDPANVTLTMSWRTGLAGKKYRGRDYIPGIISNDSTQDDHVGSALAAILAVAAQAYTASWIGTAFRDVIFHRADNTITPVISWVIDTIIDSQRRRLPARGR